MARKNTSEILERGNIYFLYRPKVQQEHPRSEKDVERFYVVLSPEGKELYRKIIIGQKGLPRIHNGGERNWAFVNKVTQDARQLEEDFQQIEYDTKTRGEREIPAVRPAGEGVYAIVRHEDHTHLAYSLELPEKPREVQDAFHIEEEASYIISIKNPEKGSPPQAGLRGEQKAEYPKELLQRFSDRRFANADPPISSTMKAPKSCSSAPARSHPGSWMWTSTLTGKPNQLQTPSKI